MEITLILLGSLAVTNTKEISKFFVWFYWEIFFKKLPKVDENKRNYIGKLFYFITNVILFLTGSVLLWKAFASDFIFLEYYNTLKILSLWIIIIFIIYAYNDSIVKKISVIIKKYKILKIFNLYLKVNYKKWFFGLVLLYIVILIRSLLN